ncbi:MAG: substrate-binding domain-containing protein [Pirellulales bacterium]
MSSNRPPSVHAQRLARGWSQQELADRAGLSRAGVSAIESGRLTPSVAAALALAQALECTVEALFGSAGSVSPIANWATSAPTADRRFWQAEVRGQTWLYPIEAESPQRRWHDGLYQPGAPLAATSPDAERTLVMACCDPAAALLAGEYERQYQFRMIVLERSSREALRLLAAGRAHVAGIHLGHGRQGRENSRIARDIVGRDCRLVRGARWEEGIAVAPQLKSKRFEDLLRGRARWVGREEGSGARQCQDQVLGRRPAPKHVARDHRSVTDAVRCGWADLGPCVRLASEEAGLRFMKVQDKDYDLCFTASDETEPRLVALLATLRSRRYRTALAELPGYATLHTGELLG